MHGQNANGHRYPKNRKPSNSTGPERNPKRQKENRVLPPKSARLFSTESALYSERESLTTKQPFERFSKGSGTG